MAEIQTSTIPMIWRYVPTESNPADAATRGITVDELKNLKRWWKGPDWLETPINYWPVNKMQKVKKEDLELPTSALIHVVTQKEEIFLFKEFSKLNLLLRVFACMLRFIHNVRSRKYSKTRKSGYLSSEEIENALCILTKISQLDSFSEEYKALRQKNKFLSSKSTLISLKPFLDNNGCIRVGGRLQRSMLSYNEKYPFIIAKDTTFAKLLVEQAHFQTLHGGQSLTHNVLLRKFWFLNGRSYVRSVLKKCVVCAKNKARTLEQIMAPLPEIRVKPQRPFLRSGVDYAGPIWMKASSGRGIKSYKGYICLFICLVTKAVHIELVSNLTSQGFISAYRRFISRRGKCAELLSDNGTNFRGADVELSKMFSQASNFYKTTAATLANDGTDWTFIPPSAPHFGGLWEAGVKSVKIHLKKIIGDQKLDYEEMSTFLTQVEACLNSRPLYAISNDPKDILSLTPGHFLIGESLLALPEKPLPNDKHPSCRYKLITQMRNHFWQRWSKEYLSHLQQLHRWKFPRSNVKIGDVVLVKDERLPPTKWALARVENVYPGSDGEFKNATLKTTAGTYKRPMAKLVFLPI